MNRHFSLLFLFVSVALFACNKDKDDAETNQRLKQIDFVYTSTSAKEEGYQLFEYDAGGRIVLVKGFNKFNYLPTNFTTEHHYSNTIEYDAGGRLQKSTYAIDDVPISSYVYRYNTSGQVVKKLHTILHPSGAAEDHVYTYDAQGRLIADSAYAFPNYVYQYNTYKYDGAGNIVTYGGGQRSILGGNDNFVLYGEGYSKYDNKKQPFSTPNQQYYVLFQLTDLLNTNNQIEAGDMNGNFKDTYHNEYQPNGLLKKRTRISSSQASMMQSYTYE